MIVYCDVYDCKHNEDGKCANKWPVGTEAIKISDEIILKNYNGYLDPIFGKSLVHEKSNGETVPVAFTVGYKFRFDGDWYGDFIEFVGEEPKLEAIEKAAKFIFGIALKSYKMLSSGVQNVPATQFDDANPPGQIKVIETGGED